MNRIPVMLLGRPTKYDSAFCQQLIDFFDVEAYREDIVNEGTTRERIQIIPGKFPTLQRFAAKIGVTKQTLWNWATAQDETGDKKHPEFFDAYTRAKDLQEAVLVEGAMVGAYNPQFAGFAAVNICNWRSKQQITGANDTPIISEKKQTDLEIARRAAFVLAQALHQQDDDCDH
jgi:hypothetical protein